MDQIKQELSLAESQLSTFSAKHTKSSATRARSHLMSVRKACDQLRKEILEQSKAHKAAKVEPEPSEPEPSEPSEVEPPEPEPSEPVKKVRKKKKKV